MANVEFYYEGKNVIIQCNKYDRMEKIIQQFMTKVGGKQNSLAFLYNGNTITNMNLTFDQLSNLDDKNRNKMNIIVSNSLTNSSPQFIFQKCKTNDETMKDYAKMAILFALQEYPHDYFVMSDIIASKFEEKYGRGWSCSFIKEGGSSFRSYDFLKILYGDYTISIANTSN